MTVPPSQPLGEVLRPFIFALQSHLSPSRCATIGFADDTGIQYGSIHGPRQFDPAKDAANREKHKVPLAFGDQIFADDEHLVFPSIRKSDGEERFKVIGTVGEKLFTGVFVRRSELPRFTSVRRSNKGAERAYHTTG